MMITGNVTNSKIINDKNITKIIIIYNKNDGKFNTLLIGGTNYIVLNNLTLASHNLNCTFHSDGIYNLGFILKGEACANSLKTSIQKTYVSCHKIIKYNFHVYGRDKEKLRFFYFVLFFMIFLSAFFLTCFSINTNCFRNYKKLKPNSIHQAFNNSQRSYIISPGFNTKDNLEKFSNQKRDKIQ